MGIILWLVIGGVVGWLASIVMKRDGSQGIILNVIVGIIGGFLGGWLLPQIGFGLGGGTLGFLITAFIGAVVLLLIINLFTRGRAR